MEWLIQAVIEVFAWLFLSGEDREWSILKISITLAVVILLMFLAYKFRS